MANFV
jgi:hypothetical protein